jgi:hypothetical protein
MDIKPQIVLTMKLSYKFFAGIMLPALLVLFALSCEKKVDEEFIPERMFMPGDIEATNGETQVKLEWNPSLFTETITEEYTVQIGKDSLFAGAIDHTLVTDSTAVFITDAVLTVKQKYFARIKANANSDSEESFWVYSSGFMITGEQIFHPINDADLKDKSVILKWRVTPGITKIVITPEGGSPADSTVSAAEAAAGAKLFKGLTPETKYTAEIFAGTLPKGFIEFETKELSLYTVTLTPGESLVDAVNNAANNDVIGLQPGTYDIKDGTGIFANLVILQKNITITSVSGDPSNTKVNFREITLKGTGAGIALKGIEFDGAPSTAAGQQALYFLNLTGVASDDAAATFTDILVENCIVHDMGNDFLRGNRAANNAHKINSVKVKNSRLYNSAMINTNYTFLQINKLEFTAIEFSNSTLYNLGRGLIDWDANLTVPGSPSILIDQCTINNLGKANLDNSLIDLNANAISVTIRNSIIANIPYAGDSVGNNLMRGANSTVTVTHSNTFKLKNGKAVSVDLVFPATVAQVNNKTIDLGWTSATTNFTLPAGHELRTSGTTGGPVGDPRWSQ